MITKPAAKLFLKVWSRECNKIFLGKKIQVAGTSLDDLSMLKKNRLRRDGKVEEIKRAKSEPKPIIQQAHH